MSVGAAAELPLHALEATLRPAAVRVSGLTRCYGGERVLDDISLTINAGEYLGLIGPNGSGKSTLLRTLVGLEPIEEGSVQLFGTDVARFRQWGRVGYVPQIQKMVRHDFPATALDVVVLGRLSRKGRLGRVGAADRTQAMAALTTVGMHHHAQRRVGDLSGGERQRVMIARALAQEPELLILDEPTTGVDSTSQDHFFSLLDRLQSQERMTIILVSHDLPVIMARAHTVACLSRSLHYHGKPEGLLEGGVIETVFGHERGLVLGSHRHEHLHPHP